MIKLCAMISIHLDDKTITIDNAGKYTIYANQKKLVFLDDKTQVNFSLTDIQKIEVGYRKMWVKEGEADEKHI